MSASGDIERAREEGREEGRIAEILRRHELHFQTINGSIEDSKNAMNELTAVVRGLAEDSRLDRERVKVAADTLATETERRREELESASDQQDRASAQTEHKFTRRERIGATVVAVVLAVAGYFIGK